MNASESYVQELLNLQEGSASMGYDLYIPDDEPIYSIDQVSRKINGPRILGVAEDHQSDKIVFEIDRECNGIDLAQTVCVIIFKNALGETYSYLIPKYNITKGLENPNDPEDSNWRKKLYFIWTLQAPVMAKAGTVQYMIKFFKVNPNGVISFELNTQIAQGIVQETWEKTISNNSNQYNILIDEQIKDLFTHMQTAIDQGYFDIYWIDL